MTSSEIRQSFLDFFKSKQHTIVPSSSLLPDSPNLLFTNAGMNQLVPIFLGQQKAPFNPPRAADTQKCIRAGGKHNDLEDVGLDTYHHTFFEMLGNWSFGDYFKKEAIEWAWELVTGIWKFPKERLYATVYCPYPNSDRWKNDLKQLVALGSIPSGGSGDPAIDALEWPDFEAALHWAEHFKKAGLDPNIHIVSGGKKDNFWMMGETGPCGPCSELHVDLTPQAGTRGIMVNKGDPQCIEIWNLVFIQYNANPGGSFSALPAKHVDTGMGLERVASIVQCTRSFADFRGTISNYETDIFRHLFRRLEQLSQKKYGSTLPIPGTSGTTEQERTDIAFRVIADHVRALSFAIADGIQPSNTDRGYVLRRILRRAVRYGRNLGITETFLHNLVGTLVNDMERVFPEIREKQELVKGTLLREEISFNQTLDNGLALFEDLLRAHEAYESAAKEMEPHVAALERALRSLDVREDFEHALKECKTEVEKLGCIGGPLAAWNLDALPYDFKILRTAPANIEDATSMLTSNPVMIAERREQIRHMAMVEVPTLANAVSKVAFAKRRFSGESAFLLYDTYGFPLDLTELLARERGLTVDVARFNQLMEEQRDRARKAQKTAIITFEKAMDIQTTFVGYDHLESDSRLLTFTTIGGSPTGAGSKNFAIVDISPFYAEAGGQVGDTGWLYRSGAEKPMRVRNTVKRGSAFYLDVELGADVMPGSSLPFPVAVGGEPARLVVERPRREAIQRHHTVTHLLHWAIHEVVSRDASQKGSYVGPEKLTFDFNTQPLTAQQVADVEKLVNERIIENAEVSWTEVPYAEVKSRKDIMQFFGEKYGDEVRVVQVGGKPRELNGYSMELCGGTHTNNTGQIGLFRIVAESAIAAGVRRIEAVAGLRAYDKARQDAELLSAIAGKINAPVAELEKKIEALLAHQKELEKQLKAGQQKQAAETARALIPKAQALGPVRAIIENLGAADGDYLQTVADALKGEFKGVIVLGGNAAGAVSLVASVSPEFTSKIQAGKLIQSIAPIVGGKGGGRPDNARGGGRDASKLNEALTKASEILKTLS